MHTVEFLETRAVKAVIVSRHKEDAVCLAGWVVDACSSCPQALLCSLYKWIDAGAGFVEADYKRDGVPSAIIQGPHGERHRHRCYPCD